MPLDYQQSPPASAPTPEPAPEVAPLGLRATVKKLRLRLGLSQRQLAGRMSVPRTYVSKVENGKALPNLSSVERLARALEVSVPEMLADPEQFREKQIAQLLSDPFVAEVVPFVSQLSEMQMRQIAATIHEMSARPRRAMA